jgi:hypothetical protein
MAQGLSVQWLKGFLSLVSLRLVQPRISIQTGPKTCLPFRSEVPPQACPTRLVLLGTRESNGDESACTLPFSRLTAGCACDARAEDAVPARSFDQQLPKCCSSVHA